VKIINDPFRITFQAVNELWPELDCDIQFNHGLQPENEECGVTIWPDDGSRVLVEISPHLSVMDSIEILGHELAHVKAGKKAPHGREWKKAQNELHAKFMEIYTKESKQYK
jgi:hypothetical protein